MDQQPFLDELRRQIIGRDLIIRTPFGRRLLHYFDWTASGRGLRFVEEYLSRGILPEYANTHTEDDATGHATTHRLEVAERILKASMQATAAYHIVHCGSGSTEAIHRLMQILGIYVPPLLLERCRRSFAGDPGLPVVFIGPYEHHSNVIPWREGLCQVVEIEPAADGGIDAEMVEEAVSDPRFQGRPKIGCFSAASNVTGMRTDVYEIARRLHRHGAYACFDLAAAAPYETVDLRGRDGAFLDAVFFSPHKFLGGPGSSGVLIFHERLYRRDLPPTFGGGGTVAYVGPQDHDFLTGIEEREKPGTPGVLQILRAALAVSVRDRVGLERIREAEERFTRKVMDHWSRDPRIEVLGHPDPARRIGIIAFNLRHGDRHLHPRFVTRLLSDLFGIQSRAGCSCAGPYGHRLLRINEPTSERYRSAIGEGCQLIKPGWVRINLHYSMTEEEVDYLLECVDFIARYGARFLDLYETRLDSGAWHHRGWEEPPVDFSLDAALSEGEHPSPLEAGSLEEGVRNAWRRRSLEEARALVTQAPAEEAWVRLPGPLEELSFFHARHLSSATGAEGGVCGEPEGTEGPERGRARG